MRIAVNTLAVMPGITVSAEIYTSFLVRALLNADTQNEYVLILRKDNRHIFPEEGERVTHFLSPVGVRSRFGRVLWEQTVLPWVCKSQRFDILLIPTGVGPLWVPCRSIVVVTVMQSFQFPNSLPLVRRCYYRWFHWFSIRQASRVVAISQQGRRDIIRYVDVDPAKVEVVYPGVPEEFRAKAKATNLDPIAKIVDGQDYILAVGPVQPYKNLDLLIRAFGIISAQGFPHHLVITSSGRPVPCILKRLVDEIGVTGRVQFIERFLSREELASLYSGAAVFVHPSSGEQFGLTVAEAMACGAPVVTSDLPSFREQVGDAGIIVEVGNLKALCDGIFAVLSDPGLQKEMAYRSLERSRQFSWNLSAQRMVTILKEVVGECGGLRVYNPRVRL